MKVIQEKNGYKLGINDNEDVVKGIPDENNRYMIEEPDGEFYVGGKKGITRRFERLTQ